jgi:L-ascorbate metabolism protein UlaG (beta-lactamase superfamily)
LKRKHFINKCLKAAAASLLIPSVINKSETFARPAPQAPSFRPTPDRWKDDEINIAWIGHATVLINFYGTWILTDPVLFETIGLYVLGSSWGPSRFTHPALSINEMPKPDIILLSHAHMDHMDYPTLSAITNMFPNQLDCITAYNTMDVIADLEWKSLQEIDWGEKTELLGVKFKALEVKHFGWRFPWEWDRSKGYMKEGRSYNAILLEKNGKKILFGGDTAYQELLKPLKEEKIDVAIMPIGAYVPWRKNHCNPEEALIMASDHINAEYFIPIHTKTFKQGREPIEEPINWLLDSVKNYNIKLGLDDIGQTFTLQT